MHSCTEPEPVLLPKLNFQNLEMNLISPSQRRFLIGYVLLVGAPLLGLMGSLRVGRSLSAPLSVGGTWDVPTIVISTTIDCDKSFADARDLAFVISQSGKYLVLFSSWEPLRVGHGEIEGRQITASSLPFRFDQANNNNDRCRDSTISLSARVNPTEPATMTGDLFLNGCFSCPALRFTAIKRPRSEKR